MLLIAFSQFGIFGYFKILPFQYCIYTVFNKLQPAKYMLFYSIKKNRKLITVLKNITKYKYPQVLYFSYNSIGKSSGSLKKANFFPVISSILICSVITLLSASSSITSSMLSTSKAICLSPLASG